jgi:hypothetical protein
LALGAVMLLPFPAGAGEKVGDIEISVQPLPNLDNVHGSTYGVRHGYVELAVRLKNLSRDDHLVHLSYPPTPDLWIDRGIIATRTVHLAGGQEAAVSLFQPPSTWDRGMLELRVEGVQDPHIVHVSTLRDYRYDSATAAAVLVSRGVPDEFRDRVHPPAANRPAPGSPTPQVRFALLRSELPVSQWSANWLGYSCYDAIVLSEKEADEMPPAVQLAVRRFVECGGTLLIHGRSVPAAFAQGGAADGKGTYAVGFGHAAAASRGGKEGWKSLAQMLLGGSLVYAYQPLEKPANLYDLLVGEAPVPVRGLFLLVLIFGVAIGPANLWLLSRYKRRIWLWWNVPAISLLTCLVVFGYSLLSEGIAGRGKTASVTLLDERCHRATTIGYLSYYCPLTPSAGPRFGADTDVALLENKLQPWQRFSPGAATGLRFVDWTSGQYLVSGWVNARVPAYFQIRKNEDRRERVIVEKKPDGSLKIVNALGAEIRWLRLADSSGRVFEERDIPAGAARTVSSARAKKLPSTPRPVRAWLRSLYASADWLGQISRGLPTEELVPGSYIATLRSSPFVESALAGVEAEHSAAIVYGISKGSDDGR